MVTSKPLISALSCQLTLLKQGTANIYHSILAYLASAGVKLLEAYATDLYLTSESFWMGTGHSLSLDAPTCNITGLEGLKY